MSFASKEASDFKTPNRNLQISNIKSIFTSFGFYYPVLWGHKVQGFGSSLNNNGRTLHTYDDTSFILPSTTPTVATLVSDDAADNGTSSPPGTGAWNVIVSGTDGDGYYRKEIVTLNGTTPVTTTNTYYLIDSAVVYQTGSGNQAGTIKVTVNGLEMGNLDPARGQMLTGHILVPKNYYAYEINLAISATTRVDLSLALMLDFLTLMDTSTVRTSRFSAHLQSNNLTFDVGAPFPPGTYARFDAFGGLGDQATIYWELAMVHTSLVNTYGHSISMPVGGVHDVETIPGLS